MSNALCELRPLRAQLFDVVRVQGLTTFSEIIVRHGRGRGCDICKVIGSILASLGTGHILEGERATLQDHVHVSNLQKDGSYSVSAPHPRG